MKLVIEAPSPELANAIGGNFDLRWVAKNFSEAVYEHDIAAVFGHNVSDLQITNLELAWGENLPSYFTHAIEMEDFHGLSVNGFSGRQAFKDSSAAVIELRRGEGFSIRDSTATPGAGTFLASASVSGLGMFVNNNLLEARQVFKTSSTGFFMSGNRPPRGRAKAAKQQ
jgi:hypothetical protein